MWKHGLTALLCCTCLRGDPPANPVKVIAHRGNHEAAHENTLEAIQNAISAGADYVELDVRITQDGRHVLMHDRTVDRMTDGAGAVKELNFETIRRLQVKDPTRPQLAPSRIPSFEEALEALGHEIGLYLDFKDGNPGELESQLRRRNLLHRTVVYLDPSQVPTWKHAVSGGLRLIVSLPENTVDKASLAAFLRRHPGVLLDGPASAYTAELVETAHALGALVWTDIQSPSEGPERWNAALRLGVDGLQTDQPSALVKFLQIQRIPPLSISPTDDGQKRTP